MFTVIYFVLTEACFPWYSAGGRTEGTSSREACVIKFVGSRLPQVVHCAFTTIFSATVLQHYCDTVSNSYNIVPTLQCCVALKIVVANRPVLHHLYEQFTQN